MWVCSLNKSPLKPAANESLFSIDYATLSAAFIRNKESLAKRIHFPGSLSGFLLGLPGNFYEEKNKL
jgi:hypothetical protein